MSDERDEVFTASAKRALDTHLAIQRQRISERAITVARNRQARDGGKWDGRVGATDMIAAISASDESEGGEIIRANLAADLRLRRRARTGLLMRLYGIALVIAGSLVGVYFQFGDTLKASAALSLAVAASGAVITLLTVALSGRYSYILNDRTSLLAREEGIYRTESRVEKLVLQSEFLTEWSELERTVNLLAAEKLSLDSDRTPSLRRMIQGLVDSGSLDSEDEEKFFSLLQIRNNLVHGTGSQISQSELREALLGLRALASTLVQRL
ncbi:hypothetical protein ACQP06_32680 [Nocardia sp. CA-136227]|uniref:hypothetical protein n=1 Tax=Nocardia sp. CA-136227 TaxID=3239979 RepID=UPI003D9769A6